MGLILAADTGGTFTDLAAYDRDGRRVLYSKSLTTYGDLTEGVMDCVRKAGIDLREAELIKFGTTLVINTFLQRNGARTALVTTRGFRDTLELRRGNRPIPFDLRYRRDQVLIPRDLRFEVNERMASDGTVLRALDPAELRALAGLLRAAGVEAVAVSFLNAYAEPRHEAEAAELLRAELPGVYVSAATDLSREWYEFERTATAAANAYVGPRMQDYVRRLDARLREAGLARSFFLMASNGGVFSVARAEAQPVMLVESGPVGGCIGAGAYAEALGLRQAIAFDMGGTTAKCAILEDGRFEVKSPYHVGGAKHGFPIRGAVLDIVEVGTGGGSIAWLDAQGRLAVGPRSAGSAPGPVCYGRGGTEPTITDANLVLGRIGANSFLGGEMSLDAAGAHAAVAGLAARMGLSGPGAVDEMAQGILALGSLSMASAIRQITVGRGLDPRDFALIAFGGGGPLHGAGLARELGIPELVVPPEPGIFSALGMILADARLDETLTFLRPLSAESAAEAGSRFAAMECTAADTLARDVPDAAVVFERQADMRFHGQRQSMRTPIGATTDPARMREIFEATYERRYGHVNRGAPLEFVGLVLTAIGRMERADLAHLFPAPEGEKRPIDQRPVFFAERGLRLPTPVFRRASLPPGFAQSGPAVIEEYGSTTVIGPDDQFSIGALGEIRVTFAGEAA